MSKHKIGLDCLPSATATPTEDRAEWSCPKCSTVWIWQNNNRVWTTKEALENFESAMAIQQADLIAKEESEFAKGEGLIAEEDGV